MRTLGLMAGVSALAVLMSGAAGAATKAKYYETCAAPLNQARELIPPPPPDIAGTAKKASDVANVASKVPGLGGMFGGLGKIASTAQTVSKYSDVIADVTKFAGKMREDYPDNAARLAAYGDRMSADADKVVQASDRLDEAHDCYAKGYEELKAGGAKDAKDRQKEIQSAVGDMSGIVADARTTINTNIKSYNDALSGDTGLNLSSLVTVAGMAGVTPASVMGLPTVPGVPNTPEAQMQAYQLAAAAQQNGYSASNSQAQNYAAIAKASTQVNTSALSLPSTPDGSSKIVEQAAAYRAQVVGQSAPTSIDPASGVTQSLGTLDSLSRLSVLSKGPMGAANLAAEAASMAKGASAAPAAAPAAPALPPGVSADMMKSLAKIGDDSGKYMGAFQRLDTQATKFTALKTTVDAKLN